MTIIDEREDLTGASGLDDFRGRINDVDSHEMIPASFWRDAFGDVAEAILPLTDGLLGMAAENTLNRTDLVRDDHEITEEAVWNVKGPEAPGAFDLTRRAAVMDAMGVDRQLLFPTFGIIGIQMLHDPRASDLYGFDPSEFDRFSVGARVIAAHNEWAAHIISEVDSNRLRPVGILDTNNLSQMISDAHKALAQGIRALWISASVPPAGTSPGDALLDPFWALMAEANVPLTFHVGSERSLLSSDAWRRGVPQFASSSASQPEFSIEPFSASTLHLTQTNFLSAMVLGGVFERHPTLRVGFIETAAYWVGPLADQLDMWFAEFRSRLAPHLSMLPSEHIARNVRVTAFHFEPIDEYFTRYPKMADVYAFSSDYPHREGGRNAARSFAQRLARLGPAVAEKFFVTNGELLLPD